MRPQDPALTPALSVIARGIFLGRSTVPAAHDDGGTGLSDIRLSRCAAVVLMSMVEPMLLLPQELEQEFARGVKAFCACLCGMSRVGSAASAELVGQVTIWVQG